jgi:crotonobetainyl-CoA:carnitine CoA-transferase CaiB-like acyl-CoA transferase
MAMQCLPLEGVRVVEMSHMIMGPSCGMFLAFLGAEVIKVEPPEGDKTRRLTGVFLASLSCGLGWSRLLAEEVSDGTDGSEAGHGEESA